MKTPTNVGLLKVLIVLCRGEKEIVDEDRHEPVTHWWSLRLDLRLHIPKIDEIVP